MSPIVRSLLRTPGFTVTVLLVLALGIGANSAIFSIVNAVLLRPLPYRDPGQLYRLDEMNPKHDALGMSPTDMVSFAGLFEASGTSHWKNVTITGPEGAENIFGGEVSKPLFPMLGTPPALGRLFVDDEFEAGGPPVALLSDRLWRRRFGRDPNILGRTLLLNGTAHTVVGIMPPDFFFDRRFELWMPWHFT